MAVYIAAMAAWCTWCQWGQSLLPPGTGSALLDALVIKNLIWLVPLLPVFLRAGEDGWLVPPSRMLRTPFPWLPCLALCCLSLAALHTIRLLNGRADVKVLFDPVFVVLSLCAGITEETFFRGYLFNRQAAVLGVPFAAALNGVLFTLYHYPLLVFGQGWNSLLSPRSALLLVMGILFSLVFAHWRQLALPITVHTVWNIASYWFGLSG